MFMHNCDILCYINTALTYIYIYVKIPVLFFIAQAWLSNRNCRFSVYLWHWCDKLYQEVSLRRARHF